MNFQIEKLRSYQTEFTNASNALANRKAQVEAVQAKIERGNFKRNFDKNCVDIIIN